MKKTVLICAIAVLVFLLGYLVFARRAPVEKAVEPEPEVTVSVPEKTPAPLPIPSPEPTPTPEPTPVWEDGTVLAYDMGILYGLAERGMEADYLGEEGKYVRVLLEDQELYIEKRFVTNAEDPIPEERTAYAKSGAEVFSSPYLTGEPLEKLKQNTPLIVIEEFGELMLVKTESTEGFIRADLVSPVKISWSGGGGGSSGGGADGGDISLGSRSVVRPIPDLNLSKRGTETEEKLAGKLRILANGAELYLLIVTAGDKLMVLSSDEETCEIWTGEETGTIPRWAIALAGDVPFEEWKGYAASKARLYDSYRLAGEYEDIKVNTVITVLLPAGQGFFVEAGGHPGYMSAADISEKQIVWSGGSGSSGGEWTAPVL